jgi:hypothetical protein
MSAVLVTVVAAASGLALAFGAQASPTARAGMTGPPAPYLIAGDFSSTKGDSPAGLGNRIAAATTSYRRRDGALESLRYIDTSFNPEGLPLVPGLIELITAQSSAPSGRHEALAGHVGEIAIRAWQGSPKDLGQQSGVGWILGTRWVPYQRPTFVTPAFPGFVSGHSTFSRAAAEVLAGYTGTPYFPGGLFESRIKAGALGTDKGPSRDVVLQSATYYDAADQAGLSRLYGGIHIAADDFAGRRIGSVVGKKAWALAQRYYNGSARP